jgi:hypothetical protein
MAYPAPRCFDLDHTDTDLLAAWPAADAVWASETASSILFDLEDGWALQGADLDAAPYEIDSRNRIITVNDGGLAPAAIARSRYFQNLVTLRTFGALRAAWQAARADEAFALHRIDLWPLLARILSADVAAFTLRMVYELRGMGHEYLWHHVVGDADGDIALEYARILEQGDGFDDAAALSGAFRQWFKKGARTAKCDFETLADMDDDLASLTYEGRGLLTEGAIRCLTLDPATGASYLSKLASEIAGDPAWRGLDGPIAQAHFAQIMAEIGGTRVGGLSMRDRKLAARLFPHEPVQA